jgi:hypothetical protein
MTVLTVLTVPGTVKRRDEKYAPSGVFTVPGTVKERG